MSVVADILWPVAVVASVYRLAAAWERFASESTGTENDFVEIPDDLLALTMQEGEAWAQEDMLRTIRERYELYHDWNRVRAAMGIGQRSDG